MNRYFKYSAVALSLCLLCALLILHESYATTEAAPLPQSSPGVRIETDQSATVTLQIILPGEDEAQSVDLSISANSILEVMGNQVISKSLTLDVQPLAASDLEIAIEEPLAAEALAIAATFTPSPTPTPSPTATATPTRDPESTLSADGERFAINQQASSERIEEIALALRGATRTDDALILQVAFENNTADALRFSFINSVRERNLRLVDAEGNGYEAFAVDDAWASVQPENGFAPGGANIGTISFPIPEGPAPYRLQGVFDFEEIEFTLDAPADAAASQIAANGNYPVDADLFSDNDVLAPLYLRVKSVDVAESTVAFNIAFVNTGLRPFGLTLGPTGEDAWLLGADGQQFTPIEVSDSIADGITPSGGIAPEEEYAGTIIFPKPVSMSELRFIFRQYTPLSIPFDTTGQLNAAVTSADGSPAAAPTPQAEVRTFREIEQMLAIQSDAIMVDDISQYLASFDVELWSDLTIIYDRMTQVPLTSVRWEVFPDSEFRDAEEGLLNGFPVQMQYTLQGIPEDNVFLHDFELSAQQQGDGSWQITAIEPDSNPPFWWLGDVAVNESEHFLIFTRPGTEDIPELVSELEFAYDVLQNQKLPVESRYVAFFTAPDESFSELTGASSPRLLGVALSRYKLEEEIEVVGRAFYINGSKFADESYAGERQSTIIHELVHVVFAPDSRPFTPPWISEGLAVYYSGQDTDEERQRLFDEGQMNTVDLVELTRMDSLGDHDFIGQATGYRYIYSGAAIRYLVDTYGEEQMLAFYRSYTEVPAEDVRDRMPLFSNQFINRVVFQELSEEITSEKAQLYFDSTLEELDVAMKEWLRP